MRGENPLEEPGHVVAVIWGLVNHQYDPKSPDAITVPYGEVESCLTVDDLIAFSSGGGNLAEILVGNMAAKTAEGGGEAEAPLA
jgi:hypothetical protein